MVFNRLLDAIGVGGPSVDTVLSTPTVRPGGTVTGHVNLVGGSRDAKIADITLHLVARVEIEQGDYEGETLSTFASAVVSGPLTLHPEERHSIPFSFPVPYETPLTAIAGQRLPGMMLGVRTEVDIDGGRDKGDADPLNIEPLPVQQRLLDAFLALGFRFKHADLESGHIRGTRQSLPFYQEIEFSAAPQYAHACSEVEVTFLAAASQVEVVLEVDKRSGLFQHGGDVIRTHVVDHTAAEQDLAPVVDGWIRQATEHRGGHHSSGHGSAWSGDGHHDSHHGHDDHHRGHGMGGLIGGVAAGIIGGIVVDEVIEEIFED